PQLVVAIGRYQDEALAEVYRRHGGALLGLARRVTGSHGEAEDVVQEVFLRLWKQPERFDPTRGALRSFLLTQAHGRSIDHVRSIVARTNREQHEARATATAGYDLEHEVLDLTLADEVTQAMSALPDAERSAIDLAYFSGYSYREVAVILCEPEGTIKARIRRGLKRMRQTLAETAAADS
ncbi:MAG TPA: sigma-70 family RNA polymerase sigma factor, partial [Acidimicrobiales bacterium]|nr:sigma-70 family RNA polymerase sigma factor [Acidimicrobiales bacterium]